MQRQGVRDGKKSGVTPILQLKKPRHREVNNPPDAQQVRPGIRIQTQAPLCGPCLYHAGTQQGGGSRRINILTLLPSRSPTCQCLPSRSPRALEPRGHPSCCVHTDQPPEGCKEVTQHLIAPTATTLVGTWASAATTPQSPRAGVPGPGSAAGGHLPVCTRARHCACKGPASPSWSSGITLSPSFLIRSQGPALLLSHANISKGPTSLEAGSWEWLS